MIPLSAEYVIREAAMSDWTKEPWKVIGPSKPNGIERSIDFAIEDGEGFVIAETFGIVGRTSEGVFVKRQSGEIAKRIVKDHNACLIFPNPEADVRVLVNVLNACRGYFETAAEVEGREGQIAMRDMVNDALVRFRREP